MAESMTGDYLAAAGQLVTENQFNRLHIDLGNTMTPLEFADLVKQGQVQELPVPTQGWLRRMQRFSPSLVDNPQPWVAEPASDRLTWYRAATGTPMAPGTATREETDRKPVLIAFCGNAERLMLPLPIVLQALPANEWDMLRVTRIPGSGHLRPGKEVADFSALVSAIATELDRAGSPEVTCVGTSSGGVPAMLAALRLGATRCISLCGAVREEWAHLLGELSGGYLPRVDTMGEEWPSFLFVHGAEHDLDRENAHVLQAMLGGDVLSVTGVEKHNVLHALMQQNRLNDEFNALMHGELQLGLTGVASHESP